MSDRRLRSYTRRRTPSKTLGEVVPGSSLGVRARTRQTRLAAAKYVLRGRVAGILYITCPDCSHLNQWRVRSESWLVQCRNRQCGSMFVYGLVLRRAPLLRSQRSSGVSSPPDTVIPADVIEGLHNGEEEALDDDVRDLDPFPVQTFLNERYKLGAPTHILFPNGDVGKPLRSIGSILANSSVHDEPPDSDSDSDDDAD